MRYRFLAFCIVLLLFVGCKKEENINNDKKNPVESTTEKDTLSLLLGAWQQNYTDGYSITTYTPDKSYSVQYGDDNPEFGTWILQGNQLIIESQFGIMEYRIDSIDNQRLVVRWKDKQGNYRIEELTRITNIQVDDFEQKIIGKWQQELDDGIILSRFNPDKTYYMNLGNNKEQGEWTVYGRILITRDKEGAFLYTIRKAKKDSLVLSWKALTKGVIVEKFSRIQE